MQRKATAVWQGDLKGGKGRISTDSGVLKDAQYGFTSRFESGAGTNPEELVAAAHAGCFSMAFSAQLGNAGMTAQSIETTANLTMEKLEAGWTVTAIELNCKATVPGGDKAKIQTAADNAKKGCPISRLLAAAKITLNLSIA